MKSINKDAKHCKKGGAGDYDVCWEPIDLCSCECQNCKDVWDLEEYNDTKHAIDRLIKSYPSAIDVIVEEYFQPRINRAVEQLNSLAVEYVHRKNGEQYAEIDNEDLQEVIDILNGVEQRAKQ